MAKKTGASNTFIPGYVPPPPPPPRPPWGDIGQTVTPPRPTPTPDPIPEVKESVPAVGSALPAAYSTTSAFNNSSTTTTTSTSKIVKTPDRYLLAFREDTTAATLEKLLFENIGGLELANIERFDTIDGKNPYYSIISNLSSIKTRLDPITLVARQRAGLRPSDFGKQINLFTKIPLDDYLRNINLIDYIFIDSDVNSETFGALIIELVDLNTDELVEIEIASNGTIYEANL